MNSTCINVDCRYTTDDLGHCATNVTFVSEVINVLVIQLEGLNTWETRMHV